MKLIKRPEDFSDRRRAKRVLVENEFLIEFKRGGKLRLEKGFGCDLSVLGLRFNTMLSFNVGETIDLVIHFSPKFSQGKDVEVSARVVRFRPQKKTRFYEVACEFVGITPEAKSVLWGFMEWMTLQPWAQCYGMDLSEDVKLGRRTAHRAEANEKFIVEFKKDKNTLIREKGIGCDISEAGISFKTLLSFRKGTVLSIILRFSPSFPGPRSVTFRGEVLRVKREEGIYYHHIACKFHSKADEAKRVIRDFVAWLNK